MNTVLKPKILLPFFILSVFVLGCNEQPKMRNREIGKIETIVAKPEYYESVDELLLRLKKEKADTVISYKRVCINCCEFYNVFWTSKGKQSLYKYYFDGSEMKFRSIIIGLNGNKIFRALNDNYGELKRTSIKTNLNKQKDGTTTSGIIDHYCYTRVTIYTEQDSIATNKIEDHDFDELTGFGFANEKKERNDNYKRNINSKWNAFLVTIDNELAAMKETRRDEIENLRTMRNEKQTSR